MKRWILTLALGMVFAASAAEDKAQYDYDKKEMDAAIAKAKSKIDDFIKVMKAGEAKNFSIKIGVSDKDQTEYFWLSSLKIKENGDFVGKIDNEPDRVKTVKEG